SLPCSVKMVSRRGPPRRRAQEQPACQGPLPGASPDCTGSSATPRMTGTAQVARVARVARVGAWVVQLACICWTRPSLQERARTLSWMTCILCLAKCQAFLIVESSVGSLLAWGGSSFPCAPAQNGMGFVLKGLSDENVRGPWG